MLKIKKFIKLQININKTKNYSNFYILIIFNIKKITSIKYFNNKFNNFKKNTNKHNALLLKK